MNTNDSKFLPFKVFNFFFIRHAPTAANYTGSMVNGYDNADIVSMEKPSDWEDRVGKFVPRDSRIPIFSSPAKRCRQTAQMLFGDAKIIENALFSEFDCAGLGDRKFWEITEQEFNDCVNVKTSDMLERAHLIFQEFSRQLESDYGTRTCIVVSHGMLIRYLYHYMNNNSDISPFDVINSKGFSFSNLDMLRIVYDPTIDHRYAKAYPYNPPVEHK